MKIKKLLKKLQDIFDLEEGRKRNHKNDLKIILKKLKMKENVISQKLNNESDPEKRAKLQKQLDIIYAQRKKGVNLLRDLKIESQREGDN